jgi:hypothetical protein
MEAEMDKLIKEKEQSVQMAMIPLEAVPLTGIRTTKASTSTKNPSIISIQVSYASEKLVKSMEYISIQGEEIRKLQEEEKNLQELKSIFQASHQAGMHKSQRCTLGVQEVEYLGHIIYHEDVKVDPKKIKATVES